MTAEPARPTLVFLHHFGGSARSWDPVVALLGDAFETVAVDLPGFGAAAAEPGPYDVRAYADRVEARVRELDRFLLVGHSMGGKIALALAARRPASLLGLVLIAPSPPTPEPIGDDMRAELIAGWRRIDSASETLARVTARPLDGQRREQAIADMMTAGKGAWRAWLKSGSREDISGLMPLINRPTLILSGERDEAIAADLVEREVAARLDRAEMVIVPGAGHLLPLETPAAVVEAIRRFVRRLDLAAALRHEESCG